MALIDGVFTDTFKALLENDGSDMDFNSANMYCALYDNTPSITAASFDTANAAYNVAPFNSGEATGTNWSAGGVSVATGAGVTIGSPAAGQFKFDVEDVSVASTTVSSIYGALIYDNGATTPADAAICLVAFSGAPYSTSNGTLAITWDTNGVFYVDLVP